MVDPLTAPDSGLCPKCGSGAYQNGVCPICGFGGERRVADMKTKRTTEDPQTSPFDCEKCGAIFPTRQALSGHMRSHGRSSRSTSSRSRRKGGSRRVFRCKRCGEEFGSLQDVAGHVSKRHGARPPEKTDASSGQPTCPLCLRPLPAPLAVVVKDFVGQGVEESQAARLAAIAYSHLHRPGQA